MVDLLRSQSAVRRDYLRRYVGPTSDYTVTKGEGASAPFTSFQDEPSVLDRPSEENLDVKAKGVGYAQSTPDKPPLFIAGDGTIAINSQKGESKEFYATQAVIDAANEALLAVSSPIELIKGGNKITVDGKDLEMVRPKIRTKQSPESDKFIGLSHDTCRDAAAYIIGGQVSAIRLGDKSMRAVAGDSTAITGTHEIAKAMAGGDSVDTALGEGEDSKIDQRPRVGEDYGTKLGKGELDTKAQEFGVNQYAKGKIGESYATQRIANTLGVSDSKDFSRPGSEEKVTWGYHFAAIVATSLDGNDQVTLENYNRANQYREAKAKLIEHLRDKFSRQVQQISAKLPDVSVDPNLDLEAKTVRELQIDKNRQIWIGTVLAKVKNGLDANENEAKQAYDAMAQETLGAVQQKWYFRMVGDSKGQSFHEQMADSGGFANPLTVVMARSEGGGMNFSFGRGETKLNSAAKINAGKWATKYLSDEGRGLHFRVQLTGYASGKSSGTKARAEKDTQKTALARANSVRDELVKQGVDNARIVVTTKTRPVTWSDDSARAVHISFVHS